MVIVWIYYGFSGAIANFVVWISLFFPSETEELSLNLRNLFVLNVAHDNII
jgi:hypothetical protein